MSPPSPIRDESGTALVEFALIVPLVLVLLLGIVDFGRAFNHWIDTTHLANVGARYATVNKNPGAAGSQTLQQYIQAQRIQQTPVKVCVSFPATTATVGDAVEVTVTSTWHWLDYLVGQTGIGPSSVIRGKATMRLEAMPTNYSAGCTPDVPAT